MSAAGTALPGRRAIFPRRTTAQPFPGVDRRAVETPGIVHEGRIATRGNGVNDLADLFGDIAGGILAVGEQRAQGAEIVRAMDGKTGAGHHAILQKTLEVA